MCDQRRASERDHFAIVQNFVNGVLFAARLDRTERRYVLGHRVYLRSA